MKALVFCIGIFSSFSALAQEAEWLEISRSVDGAVTSMDLRSPRVSGQTVTAWFRLEKAKPIKSKQAASDKVRVKIDCANERLATLSVASYDASGALVTSAQSKFDDWRDVIPESVGQSMMEHACVLVTK